MRESAGTSHERCSWCGAPVEEGDGYRLLESPGERHAVFCRLEHVVPWAIRGAHWEPGIPRAPVDGPLDRCAQCGAELGDVRIVLVHELGEERVPDAFCSVDHVRAWAGAGGRYG
jgi:hypothetical protein